MAYKYRILRALGKPISVIVKVAGRTKVVSAGQTNFAALVSAIENGAPDEDIVSLLDNVSIIDRILKDSENFLNDATTPPPSDDEDEVGVEVGGDDAPPVTTVTDAATTITRAAAWSLDGEQVNGGGKALVNKKKTGYNIFIKDGLVHVNGIPLDNKLTDLILRYVANNELDKVGPLALFLGRVISNPSDRSRTELFEFMSHHSYRLSEDGRFYAYKSVRRKDRMSGHRGHENVTVINAEGESEVIKGHIPHRDGSVLVMDRAEVDDNSGVACGRGLHIGSKKYAEGFGNEKTNIVLRVLVDPEHVVAVPRDEPSGKMRACQLEVVGPASQFIKKKGTVVL